MHANLWNLRHSKERLGILERTYAQKKHIESLITAKSAVDSHFTVRNSLISSKNSCRHKDRPSLVLCTQQSQSFTVGRPPIPQQKPQNIFLTQPPAQKTRDPGLKQQTPLQNHHRNPNIEARELGQELGQEREIQVEPQSKKASTNRLLQRGHQTYTQIAEVQIHQTGFIHHAVLWSPQSHQALTLPCFAYAYLKKQSAWEFEVLCEASEVAQQRRLLGLAHLLLGFWLIYGKLIVFVLVPLLLHGDHLHLPRLLSFYSLLLGFQLCVDLVLDHLPIDHQRLNMIVPILHKSDVVIILAGVLEHHSDLAAERVEHFLLVKLALEGQVHALMVLLDQLLEALLCPLVLLSQHLIVGLQFFQFSDLLAHEVYLLLQKILILCQDLSILLVNLQSLLHILDDQPITKGIPHFLNRFNFTKILHCPFLFLFFLILLLSLVGLLVAVFIQFQ